MTPPDAGLRERVIAALRTQCPWRTVYMGHAIEIAEVENVTIERMADAILALFPAPAALPDVQREIERWVGIVAVNGARCAEAVAQLMALVGPVGLTDADLICEHSYCPNGCTKRAGLCEDCARALVARLAPVDPAGGGPPVGAGAEAARREMQTVLNALSLEVHSSIADDVRAHFRRYVAAVSAASSPVGALTEEEWGRLAEIAAREKKASYGPWQTRFIYRAFQEARKSNELLTLPPKHTDWDDSAFMAEARSDVPWLLALVARLSGGRA